MAAGRKQEDDGNTDTCTVQQAAEPSSGGRTVLPQKKPQMYAKQSLHTTMPHGITNLRSAHAKGLSLLKCNFKPSSTEDQRTR